MKKLVSTNELDEACQYNWENALRVALLLLPNEFNEEKLYSTIAGISYLGDIRMGVGENPNKVLNIVKPNIHHFRELYLPILQSHSDFASSVHFDSKKELFTQDLGDVFTKNLISKLPNRVQQNVSFPHHSRQEASTIVSKNISAIISKSSLSQSLKGIITSGLSTSLQYGARKIVKNISGRIK